ncbi:MAG: AAA family ATPase, partial [Candidatus Diapherotrites archaeon]|nr:AAA family ATPase [Candidatus Diapherotrites archaeon]
MTRLVKLSLKNFKSFKKAEIPITKGFTAIVGSNGSGKSNILDALLFVLGITSLKTLRAGKLTDLVNNDARESYGKVDLIIKDNDKQYEISRMVDKQGKSVYRLDGKRTTLNEISSLLMELGIDVDGHNIVTQGDITKIIEMSPIERREIIDNIAGLSEFDEKKNEAIKELDKVDSRIKEATIILNERNTFLSELEEEMKAAKEFSELETEKSRTKATILTKELYALEKKVLDADNEIAELEKQKGLIEERITQARTGLDESKKASASLATQMIRASERTYSTIGREFEEKKGKLLLEQNKIDSKNEQKTKNNEKIELNKIALVSLEKEKNELNLKIASFKSELLDVTNNLNDSLKKRESLEASVKSKNLELQKEEEKADEYSREIDSKKKDIFELEVNSRNHDKQKMFNEKKLVELLSEESLIIEEMDEIEEKKNTIKEHLKKEPHKNAGLLENTLMELLEQKNLFGSKRSHEEKAVSELRKAISQCPTCDSSLNEDKKQLLLQQKEVLIREYAKREAEHAESISQIKKRLEEERERITLLSGLNAEIAHEGDLLKKYELLKNKITSIKSEIESKQPQEQSLKFEKITSEILELESKKKEIWGKITPMRSMDIFSEYSSARVKVEELVGRKSSIDSEIKELILRIKGIESRINETSAENNNLDVETEKLLKEIASKERVLAQIKESVIEKEKELLEAKKKNAILAEEKEYSDKKIDKLEKEISIEYIKLKKLEGRITEFSIEKSKLGVRQADLTEENKAFTGIEPFSSKSLEECRERMIFIEKRLGEIGAVNMKAMDNFNELKKEVDDIQQKATKLSEERLAVLDMIDKIEVKRTLVFMDCFSEVNKNFQDIFFKFFSGEGNLSLSDPLKPLESGLLVDAKHKAGKLINIDSMSGGEKTLTALAFMFSIQLYHPAPFYAFDEADAALDKENSLKMSNLIEKIAEKSQFIAITHNDVITKKAHQIIGVARGKDDSS